MRVLIPPLCHGVNKRDKSTASAFLFLTWRQRQNKPPKRWRHYFDAIQSATSREQDKAWGIHNKEERLSNDIVGKVGAWLPKFSTNTMSYPCATKHRTSWSRTEQSCFVSGRSKIQTSAQRPNVPTCFRADLHSLQADARAVLSLRPLWFFYSSSLTSSYYLTLYSTAIQFIYSACHSSRS